MLYGFLFYGYPQGFPAFSFIEVVATPYLQIGEFTIYPNSDTFLNGFKLKDNRRGGDTGSISFAKMAVPFEVGDMVKFYVNNKVRWAGYIEQRKIREDYELTVIPEWSRLSNQIVSGGIVLEAALSIREVVQSVLTYIYSAGIGVTESSINIPPEYFITLSTMGKNVREILDECEKNLPPGYIWGVRGGIFFFRQEDEIIDGVLNWHYNDFGESEFDEDFTDVYTETSVFSKEYDPDGNEYSKSVGVVGRQAPYPPIGFKSLLGVKVNKLEFPFQIFDEDALDTAYNQLVNQYLPVKISIKNLNYEQVLPRMLEAYKVYGKPKKSLTIKFTRTGGAVSGTSLSLGGQIQEANTEIQAYNELIDSFNFNLKGNGFYQDYCNASEKVERVFIRYSVQGGEALFRVSDGVTNIEILGSGNFASVDVLDYNFNKRELNVNYIGGNNPTFSFKDVFITFENGQEISSGNVREISYEMDKRFILKVNVTVASLGMILNGYLWAQQKKLETLAAILDLKGAP